VGELKSTEECGVCGKTLTYQPGSQVMQCIFCGKSQNTNIFCPQGHYVCDECHAKDALSALKQVLDETKSTSPGDILEMVMAHKSVPMHGPEHHAIVPAVIVTAARNAGYAVPDNALEQALARGGKVPGGWCGFAGSCGAAVGVGIAVSCLTKATPLTGKERSLGRWKRRSSF
jgi:7,8-dihydro-6-hydroxymethylpterin dimethyltransferase